MYVVEFVSIYDCTTNLNIAVERRGILGATRSNDDPSKRYSEWEQHEVNCLPSQTLVFAQSYPTDTESWRYPSLVYA
jgi:hypothetical protein